MENGSVVLHGGYSFSTQFQVIGKTEGGAIIIQSMTDGTMVVASKDVLFTIKEAA